MPKEQRHKIIRKIFYKWLPYLLTIMCVGSISETHADTSATISILFEQKKETAIIFEKESILLLENADSQIKGQVTFTILSNHKHVSLSVQSINKGLLCKEQDHKINYLFLIRTLDATVIPLTESTDFKGNIITKKIDNIDKNSKYTLEVFLKKNVGFLSKNDVIKSGRYEDTLIFTIKTTD